MTQDATHLPAEFLATIDAYHKAEHARQTARDLLVEQVRQVRVDLPDISEVHLAATVRVSRRTIRSWLGVDRYQSMGEPGSVAERWQARQAQARARRE